MPSSLPIIFVLGAPGAGKSTLCKWLSEPKPDAPPGQTLKVHHILIRELMRQSRDRLPPDVCALLDQGDALTLNDPRMVACTLELLHGEAQRLFALEAAECAACRRKFVDEHVARGQVVFVDGFPRAKLAAQEWEESYGHPLAVIELHVRDDVASARVVRRGRDARDTADVVAVRRARNLDGLADIADMWQDREEIEWIKVDTSKNTTPADYMPLWNRLMESPWFRDLWVDDAESGESTDLESYGSTSESELEG